MLPYIHTVTRSFIEQVAMCVLFDIAKAHPHFADKSEVNQTQGGIPCTPPNFHLMHGLRTDAAGAKWVNMVEAGIIDPAKVARCALQNAASIAGMLLTTECAITDIPEPPAPPAPQGAGGMDGMY